MFCTKCGSPNDEDWEFCCECGTPLKKAQPGKSKAAPVEPPAKPPAKPPVNPPVKPPVKPPVNPPVQPPVNPPEGPGAGKVIIIALVVLVCVIALASLFMGRGCSGDSGSSSSTISTTTSTRPTPPPEPDTVSTEQAYEHVNGWWQSVGQSGSVFHHFVDGIDFIYQRDFDDQNKFSYLDTRGYTVEPFSAGELSFTDDSGVAVHFDDGGTYILEDGDEGFLTCRNMDGSGYSGSGSLARPSTGDIPEGLVKIVSQVEGSGSTSTPVSTNPSSLDVSGSGKGEIATLTGVISRKNLTPAETGMVWGVALYYLELPEPVTITYNGIDGPTTKEFNRIQVWADEANPTVNEDEAYYAEHPEEISNEYDQYIGSTLTIRGHIIDAGTAHYHGAGCFIDAEIVS